MPVYGLLTWHLLIFFNVGLGISGSNFVIENLYISIATIVATWLRVAFPGKRNEIFLLSSLVSMLLLIIFTIILRMMMPCLPE